MAVILFKSAAVESTTAALAGQRVRVYLCMRVHTRARSLVNVVTTDAFSIAGYKQGG